MKDITDLLKAAYESNDRVLVEKAFSKLVTHSLALDTMFQLLALKHPKYGADFFVNETLMPAVYSSDVRHHELVKQRAKHLKLGEKSVIDFSGSKSKGHSATIAIETLLDVFNAIRADEKSTCKNAQALLDNDGRRVLKGIIGLPELDQTTSGLWISEMVEYLTLWAHVPKEVLNDKIIYTIPLHALVEASLSYANSRLTERKKRKLKVLNKAHPDGEPFKGLNISDLSFGDASVLTRYRLKLDEIDSMQLDDDCYRYGLKRLLTEKMKKLRG